MSCIHGHTPVFRMAAPQCRTENTAIVPSASQNRSRPCKTRPVIPQQHTPRCGHPYSSTRSTQRHHATFTLPLSSITPSSTASLWTTSFHHQIDIKNVRLITTAIHHEIHRHAPHKALMTASRPAIYTVGLKGSLHATRKRRIRHDVPIGLHQ